jgi:RNA polymerase sigma factor (sigma-70 family)
LGDPVAREILVKRLRPQITRMALYYAAKTKLDADDLLQEAWLGLLHALPSLNMSIGDPLQHLLCQARWRIQDYVRRCRLRQCEALEENAGLNTLASGTDVQLDDLNVRAFIDRLPEHRRYIVRNIMDGKTWREAGDALGCSGANVAYHIRQIRREFEKWQK